MGSVAVLEVDRKRQVGGAVERRDVSDRLVEGHPAVATAEREGEAGARCRECLEPERGEDAGRAGVPGIGDHERVAGVERRECRRFFSLPGVRIHAPPCSRFASASIRSSRV